MNPIPVDDDQGKDVTVNWKFYNGFEPRGTFWTDSNALEMQKRTIKEIPFKKALIDDKQGPNFWTIPGNFYPIDSAISMRD